MQRFSLIQTLLPARGVTSSGFSSPFLVGCHILATSGKRNARLFVAEILLIDLFYHTPSIASNKNGDPH